MYQIQDVGCQIFFYLCISITLLGCSISRTQTNQEAVLFAAASTTDAVLQIVEQFTNETNIKVNTNFASSSVLSNQINAGADADVYLSANVQWADFLEENGLAAKRIPLLSNGLVLVVPKEIQIKIETPEDLLQEKVTRISIADPTSVPAGTYAKKALSTLGLWQQIAPKVVRGADVRQSLAYVETKEVEAGIVYSTDAAISDQVKIVHTFDPALMAPIEYPLVLTKTGLNNPSAKKLYQYLSSQAALEIFQNYGFLLYKD